MSLSFKDLLGQVVTLPGLMDMHTGRPLLLTVVDIPVARDFHESSQYEYRHPSEDGVSLASMITNDMTRVVCAYMNHEGVVQYVEARFGALRGQPKPIPTKSTLMEHQYD